MVVTFVAALKGLHRTDIMQFPQKFCPLCDKQVIASALRQLGINFTCIFQSFPKIALWLRQSGNFGRTLKIRLKLILNCLRAYTITCTKK